MVEPRGPAAGWRHGTGASGQPSVHDNKHSSYHNSQEECQRTKLTWAALCGRACCSSSATTLHFRSPLCCAVLGSSFEDRSFHMISAKKRIQRTCRYVRGSIILSASLHATSVLRLRGPSGIISGLHNLQAAHMCRHAHRVCHMDCAMPQAPCHP
jgi:hypothetical protein